MCRRLIRNDSRPVPFKLEASATPVDVRELFQRIGAHCRRTGETRVIVHVIDSPPISDDCLLTAVASLAEGGCPEGFKVGWVTDDRGMFETLVKTEYPITRSGITARAFVDEDNARQWLAW